MGFSWYSADRYGRKAAIGLVEGVGYSIRWDTGRYHGWQE
jgi:hypothetical protein